MKAVAIADKEIEVRNAEKGSDQTANQKNLSDSREEKSALLDRFMVVLNAYEMKGGDSADYRKYASAVSGLKVEMTDVGSTWSAISGWLTSKEGGAKIPAQIARFLAIMIVFWFISVITGKVVGATLKRSPHFSDLMKRFVNRMVHRLILFIGLLIALGTLGVNVGAAVALIGGGAFVIAFALKDTLGNLANGIMLLIYQPFDVRDVVEIGGVVGSVESVNLVYTALRTGDNRKVLIPNKNVWGQVITNITGMTTRRVDLTFSIGYDDDIDKAKEILERIVTRHELVLEDPAPVVQLHELADSSVYFICRPWVNTSDYWAVHWAVTKAVKKEFDAAGISIPYPQRDVHVHQVRDQDPADA